MQFNQPIFFLFVFCFIIGWRWINPRSDFRLTYLVFASLIFYSWAGWRPLCVLILVGVVSFCGGVGIGTISRYKRFFLLGTIFVNTGILFLFRYSDFLAANLEALFAYFKVHLALRLVFSGINRLPILGIGFYVLQSISYVLDSYYGRIQPTSKIIPYFAYLSMFPKLLAGPIERGRHLLTQLVAPILPTTEKQRWEGTRSIVYGYFLKVVIADNLSPFVDAAFNNPRVSSVSLFWWVSVTAFAIQLYCDFSGYSSIAVGLGKWMGYDLTINFKNPYSTTSMAEFWTRWHISLSSWLRDYIFFPLNRSRLGRGRPHLSMWITMVVSGLWHGANWNFIAWGGIQGMYISLERLTQWPSRLKRYRGGILLASVLVLLQIWVGWAFFRANNLTQGFQIVKTMLSFQGGWQLSMDPNYIFFLSMGIVREIIALLHFNTKPWIPAVLKNGVEVCFISLLMVACVLLRGPGSQFIYFQF
jgi:alginate O-acetyltransferase complex protein AlgI